MNITKLDQIRWGAIVSFCESNQLKYYVTAIQGAENAFKNQRLKPASPQQWLSYYKNAKVVFTNTFHGTVFAIIFHKPFLVILQNGETKSQNRRIISLLRVFHLEDRIWQQDQEIVDVLYKPIDWSLIENIRMNELSRTNNFFSNLGL